MKASFTRTGDWGRFRRVAANMKRAMYEAQWLSLDDFGQKAVDTVRGHIESQDIGWKPLAQSTQARKSRSGYPDMIYVETKNYLGNITYWVQGSSVFIGMKQGATNEHGYPLEKIATILEFGNTKIPARPLWQPSAKEVQAWYESNYRPYIHLRTTVNKYFS